MKELENFLKSKDIENDYHSKIFEEAEFEILCTKINLVCLNEIRNRIYWLSLLIYRISLVNYLKSFNNDINFKENTIRIKKNNLIIFHPAINISSEICKQLKNDFVYPSSISYLCRQIIEQICLIKEIEKENVEEKTIVEAMIESYSKQLGSDSLNIEGLNLDNKGLLKVFRNKTNYGKLANKYNYGYMYNLFSGDIHILSQINKLIPFSSKIDNRYYEIYLNCVLTILRDYLITINTYNKEVSVDLKALEKVDFIDIKKNKKV